MTQDVMDIIFNIVFPALYRFAILALLYRIGTAILDQTEYLKGENEIDEIGNNR